MNINRDKHNKYVVNWTPTITTDTSDSSTSQSGGSNTIIYVSGGGGSSSGGGEPTVVEQDSFAYYKISDGTTTIVQAASIPKDTANITFMGDENVQITVSSDPAILKEQFVSTGTNTGTYEISYQKVIVEQEVPVEPEEPDTQAEGETETIQVTTWPLTLTYISGTKLQTTEFDVLNLYNVTEDGETLVATFTNTQLTIEGDTSGVSSISVDCGQINFSRIVLSLADAVILSFDVKIIEKGIVYIQGKQQDKYWKLDENGNLYTEYNAYSTRELSAYGLSSSEDPTVGALYLKDLLDVSVDNPADNAILQYNSTTQKWEATTAQDLTGLATQEWVTTQITNLKNEIDPQLDELDGKITALDGRVTTIEGKFETVEEAIEQLLDWFSFVDGRIRANYDLWGVGEISAYGYNTSEQPAGKEYLRDLLDVNVDNATNGQILVFNGSVWVSQDIPETGLNESELAQYLTENNYVQTSDLSTYATKVYVDDRFTTLIGDAPAELDTLGEIAEQIILLQQMLDWFSFVDGKIRANYDLWGIGEISAYGVGEGSSSGGKNYLRELEDVLLGDDLASGQLLQYNGTYWVNIDKDEVGLNETELANYLTQNNYLQQGDVTWSNLSGKPSTFNTTINQINDLNSSWDSLLLNPPTDYVTRWPAFSEVTDKPTTLAGYGITDAYTKTETDNRYVNITGDTMTGNLTLPALIANDYVRIGSTARLEYDSVNNAIKVTNASGGIVNFYATGEVSAYGAGSGSTISGYLNDLQDVTISNATKGQALIFNGSQWVNQTIQQGLDEEALYDYLTENSYLQSSDITVSGSGNIVTNVTASSGTVTVTKGFTIATGAAGKLAYYTGSTTIGNYASTIGGSSKLWYLNAGVPTNSTATVGSNYIPVWLNSGVITASSQDFMVERGVWRDTSSGNWNNILTPGMYSLSEWGSNGPTNAGYEYGTVAVFKSGSSAYGGAVTQIYFPHANASNGIYAAWRTTYQESSSRWANWHYLLDTGNYAGFLNNYYVRKTGDNMTGSLTNTADFTAGGGFHLTSSHGRMIWDSGTSAMWLQSSSSGKLYLSGWQSTYLTNLQLYAKRTDIPAGALYITNTGYGNTLNLCRNEANTASMLTFSNSSGIVGYLGMSSTSSFTNWPKNTPSFGTSQSSNWVLHNSRDNIGMWAVYVDLKNLSDSNFYPFVWSISRGYNSDIEVQITSDSVSASAKWNQNHIHFIARAGGWSDNGSMLIILNHRFFQANEVTIGSIGFGNQNGTMCVWLRGGCGYSIYHTGVITDTYHTSSYSIGGATYTVGKNFYGGSNSNVSIQWSPTTSGVNNKMYINGGTITSVGSIVSQGEITAYSSSDIRFKTDIHNLTGLDYIRKMRPVEYNWTDEALELKANKVRHGYGLIAQELEQIIPDLVTHNMFNEGYLGIDYTRLVPFTISAIQEVDDEVTRLKKRVKELENKISKYEKLNRQRTTGINISDATICS